MPQKICFPETGCKVHLVTCFNDFGESGFIFIACSSRLFIRIFHILQSQKVHIILHDSPVNSACIANSWQRRLSSAMAIMLDVHFISLAFWDLSKMCSNQRCNGLLWSGWCILSHTFYVLWWKILTFHLTSSLLKLLHEKNDQVIDLSCVVYDPTQQVWNLEAQSGRPVTVLHKPVICPVLPEQGLDQHLGHYNL